MSLLWQIPRFIGKLVCYCIWYPLYGLVRFVENTEICEFRDPKWADVKLAQAKYLLSRLAQFRDLVSDKFDCIPAVTVAGDFNSTPGDKVRLYFLG